MYGMFYMVISKHSPESCPGRPGNEEIHPCMGSMAQHMQERNIRIVGSWVESPAHINYMVREAESAHLIQEPFMESGLFAYTTTEIRPVLSMTEE